MSRKIGLDLALKTLSKAKYVTECKGHFQSSSNGLELHKNLISKFLKDSSASRFVDSLDSLKGSLVKAADNQSFISTPVQAAHFQFNACPASGISVIDDQPTVKTLTVLKDTGSSKKWTFAYQDLLRHRRTWWKQLFFDPAGVNVIERDARSETPSAKIEATFGSQDFGLPNNAELESLRMLDQHEVREFSGQDHIKIVMTETHMVSGTLALMLDSVRYRLYASKSAPPRIALLKDLVPFHLAFCTVGSDPDLADFIQYLSTLMFKEGVKVWDLEIGDYFNEYDACDGLGVPFLVIVTPQSLKDGVVNIRDRETTWFEQIHAADLAKRFVRCFQDRDV